MFERLARDISIFRTFALALQIVSVFIGAIFATNVFITGMSMVLSKWIITPIKVGWIRPINR